MFRFVLLIVIMVATAVTGVLAEWDDETIRYNMIMSVLVLNYMLTTKT